MQRRTRRCPPVDPNLLVIGVDVAKQSHVAVASSSDGRTRKPLSFPATKAGFESLRAYAEKAMADVGARGWVVGLEPTGHYGQPLSAWLRRSEVPVFLVQPLHTNRAKELWDGTSRKTDAKDAAVIADLCRRGVAQPVRALAAPFAALRVLSRQREQLVKRRSQAVNRLHRHVDVVFPELCQVFPKLEGATMRWLLRHAGTPEQVLGMPREQLLEGIRRASRGQLREERLEALLEAARDSIGVRDGLPAHRLTMRQLLDESEAVLKQLAEIEQAMTAELAKVPYASTLLTLPKLGRITLATLLGEFGDLRDYRVAQQLLAMAGLDLVETSSGERKGQRHISRKGRRYARQLLFMAALRLGNGVLAEPRRRLVEDRKVQPTKAAVANMCRLLRILHAMARDGSRFDATRYAAKEAQAA